MDGWSIRQFTVQDVQWLECLFCHVMGWERGRKRDQGGKVEGGERSTEHGAQSHRPSIGHAGHPERRTDNTQQTTDGHAKTGQTHRHLTVTLGPSCRLTPHASCAALRSAFKHLWF